MQRFIKPKIFKYFEEQYKASFGQNYKVTAPGEDKRREEILKQVKNLSFSSKYDGQVYCTCLSDL